MLLSIDFQLVPKDHQIQERLLVLLIGKARIQNQTTRKHDQETKDNQELHFQSNPFYRKYEHRLVRNVLPLSVQLMHHLAHFYEEHQSLQFLLVVLCKNEFNF